MPYHTLPYIPSLKLHTLVPFILPFFAERCFLLLLHPFCPLLFPVFCPSPPWDFLVNARFLDDKSFFTRVRISFFLSFIDLPRHLSKSLKAWCQTYIGHRTLASGLGERHIIVYHIARTETYLQRNLTSKKFTYRWKSQILSKFCSIRRVLS